MRNKPGTAEKERHLSDAALVLLSHAAGREDGMLLPAPETVRARGGALAKVLTKLLRQGLVEEADVGEGAHAWRSGDAGERVGLRIAAAGLQAIGVEARSDPMAEAREAGSGPELGARPAPAAEPPSTGEATSVTGPTINPADAARGSAEPGAESVSAAADSAVASVAAPAVKSGTKQALLVESVGGPSGAAISDLVNLLGWQPHTVRAALTGLRRKGYSVTRSRSEGETIYRASLPESVEGCAGDEDFAPAPSA